MVDIFDEVNEELRRDQLAKLWKRHGWLVITLAAVIVVVVAGWRGWQYWSEVRAQRAGDAFAAALKLSAEDKHEESRAAFAELARDAPSGYAVLARFRGAAEQAALGKVDDAALAFDRLAGDGYVPEYLRDIARLRAGLLFVDTDRAKAENRLRELVEPSNPLRHLAREFIGLAALKANDLQAAETWLTQLGADTEAPREAVGRAEALLGLIRGSGAPPPPEQKTGS